MLTRKITRKRLFSVAVHGNTKKYKIYKMRKNDSAKTNGFYNNSNVIRIECELRGVGLVPYSAFEASKVRDIRLEPVQHYSYYKDIR